MIYYLDGESFSLLGQIKYKWCVSESSKWHVL